MLYLPWVHRNVGSSLADPRAIRYGRFLLRAFAALGLSVLTAIAVSFCAVPARAAEPEQPTALYQRMVTLTDQGAFAEAETVFQQGMALCAETGPDRPSCEGRFALEMGTIRYRQRRYDEAAQFYADSAKALDRPGVDKSELTRALANNGDVLVMAAKYADGIAALQHLHAVCAKAEVLLSSWCMSGAYWLLTAEGHQNDAADGIEWAQDILQRVAATKPPANTYLDNVKTALVSAYEKAGRLDDALTVATSMQADADASNAGPNDSRRQLALRLLAQIHFQRHEFPDAEALAKAASDMAKEITPFAPRPLLYALEILAQTYSAEGRYQDAVATFEQADVAAQQEGKAGATDLDSLLATEENIALAASDYAYAEEVDERVLIACQSGGASDDCEGQYDMQIGNIRYRAKRYEDAAPLYAKSAAARDNSTSDKTALIDSLVSEAAALIKAKKYADADPVLDRVDEICQETHRTFTARCLDGVGWFLISGNEQRKPERAIVAAEAVLQLNGAPTAPDRNLVHMETFLTGALRTAHRLDEALTLAKAVQADIATLDLPPTDALRANAINTMAAILLDRKDLPQAEETAKAAVEAEKQVVPLDTHFVADALLTLGEIYFDEQRYPEAKTTLREAEEEAQKEDDTSVSDLALVYNTESNFGSASADYAYAEEAQRKLIPVSEKLGDPDLALTIRVSLGVTLHNENKYPDSEKTLRAALDDAGQAKLPDRIRAYALFNLADLYHEIGKYKEGIELARNAVALAKNQPEDNVVIGIPLNDAIKNLEPNASASLAALLLETSNYNEAKSVLTSVLAQMDQQKTDPLGRANTLQLLGEADTDSGDQLNAERSLKKALDLTKQFSLPNDSMVATITEKLGEVERKIGDYEEAERLLNQAIALCAAKGENLEVRLANGYEDLAWLFEDTGRTADAKPLLQKAISITLKRLGPDSRNVAILDSSLAKVEARLGDWSHADQDYQRALSIWTKVYGPDNPILADDLVAYANFLLDEGHEADAKAKIDKAVEITSQAFGPDCAVCAGSLWALARFDLGRGDASSALTVAQRVASIMAKKWSENGSQLAPSLVSLARIDVELGRFDDAGKELDRAAAVQSSLPPDHPLRVDTAVAQSQLAGAEDKHDDQVRDLELALRIAEKTFGLDDPTRQDIIGRLAGALLIEGKSDDALQLARTDLSDTQAKFGTDSFPAALAARNLASVLSSTGHLDEAESLYRDIAQTDGKIYGPDSRQSAADHLARGTILRLAGRYAEAKAEFQHANDIFRARGDALATAATLDQLAALTVDEGNTAEAIVDLETALDIRKAEAGADEPGLAGPLAELGFFYERAGRKREAEEMLEKSQALIGSDPADETPGLVNYLQLQASLLMAHGDEAGAETASQRLIGLETRQFGANSAVVGLAKYNLGVYRLTAKKFSGAIDSFGEALTNLRHAEGNQSPQVGRTLLGASRAYLGLGDKKKAAELASSAMLILGKISVDQMLRQEWL